MFRLRTVDWVVFGLAALTTASPARAQDLDRLLAVSPARAVAGEILLLEVWINGQSTNLVATVERRPDGAFHMTDSELKEVGISPGGRSGMIRLADLPDLTALYDEAEQRLLIDALPSALMSTVIDLRGDQSAIRIRDQPLGGVLNYVVSVDGGQDRRGQTLKLSSTALGLDGRLFGPFGAVTSSASTVAIGGRTRAVRLNTSWNYFDPLRMREISGGDLINGGFDWTRPIRMAGLQVRRNFATRPDLITTPSPSLKTSAAAPSTLDLYLNGAPVLSRKVGAGPVQIEGLPATTGASEARLVLRDDAGRETVVVAPFFSTPMLLRRGFVDYAMEAGFARRGFGARSSDYLRSPLASASLRYGLTDAVTLEGHGEVGGGLVNVGGGAAMRLGGVGAASVSATGSSRDGQTGALVAAVFDARFAGVYLSARAQEVFNTYQDLASVTSEKGWRNGWWIGDEPPRSIRQLTASAPLALGGEPTMASLSYSSQVSAMGMRRDLWSASLRKSFHRKVTVFVTAYRAKGGDGGTGGFLGLTVPLGRVTATAGVENQGADTIGFVETGDTEDQAANTASWRLRGEYGARSRLEGRAAYRAETFRAEAAAQLQAGAVRAQGQVEGAFAWIGGAVSAANRLDGAFAMVEVGAPGLPILYRNQKVGVSNSRGRVLVRNLQAFDDNTIEIDTRNLALGLEAPLSEISAAPMAGGGVMARFEVVKTRPAVLVRLARAKGEVVPAGSEAVSSRARLIVGYDGELFVPGEAAGDRFDVDMGEGGHCQVDIPLARTVEGGLRAEPLVCR